jgi:hypothetical protein
MPEIPWVQRGSGDAGGELLALVSHLPLRRYSSTPQFFRYVAQIRKQLSGARGLVGYSLRARPWSKQYWTLSLWTGREALDEFVRTSPHRDVMASLMAAGAMAPTRFVTWTVPGTTGEVTWAEGISHLRAGR